jgi:hypothetical protein
LLCLVGDESVDLGMLKAKVKGTSICFESRRSGY